MRTEKSRTSGYTQHTMETMDTIFNRFIKMMCELVRFAGEIKGIHDRARAKYDSEQYQVSFDHFDCAKVIERLTDNDTDIFANLKKNKKSSTQLTASICEKHVFDAFVQEGFTPLPQSAITTTKMNGDTCKKFLRKRVDEEDFQVDISMVPVLFGEMEHGVRYIMDQPFGSQSPPDILLMEIVRDEEEKDVLFLLPIEVKQGAGRPTYNNNPPKAGFGYVFFCTKDAEVYYESGKDLRGENIVVDEVMKHLHIRFCALCQKHLYPDGDTEIRSYRKTEPKTFKKKRG